MKDTVLFFQKFLKNRETMGSLTPSSIFLAKAIAKMIPFKQIDHIVELGGGTGAITETLVLRKRKETHLVVFEPDPEFYDLLKKKFRHTRNVTMVSESAENLRQTLRELKLPSADCIVSSVPFALLRKDKAAKIFQEIQMTLTPRGVFVLYQYTLLALPKLLEYFKVVGFSFVLLNVPPALVFLCSPRADL